MTGDERRQVAGVRGLLGRGVYTSIPDILPAGLCSSHVVVVADPATGAAAVRRLCAAGCTVTLVTCGGQNAVSTRREIRRHVGPRVTIRSAHLEWAVGKEHLEAVLLRCGTTGEVEALNAGTLFILAPEPDRAGVPADSFKEIDGCVQSSPDGGPVSSSSLHDSGRTDR